LKQEMFCVRVIAIQNFHPPGLPRPIRPGEVLDADEDVAHAWLGQGLVVLERTIEPAEEQAIVAPAEAPAAAPKEKATRKPRESAARRKR
jgi:hypothetical protein